MGDDATSKPNAVVHDALKNASAAKSSGLVIQGDSETFAVGPREVPRTRIELDAPPAVMVRPSLVDDLEMSEAPPFALDRMQIAPAKPPARLALEPAFGRGQPIRRLSPARGLSAVRGPESAIEPVRRMSPPRGIALEPLVKNVPGTPPLRSLSPAGGMPATRVPTASTPSLPAQTDAAPPHSVPPNSAPPNSAPPNSARLTAVVADTLSEANFHTGAVAPEVDRDESDLQSAHKPMSATQPASSSQQRATAVDVRPDGSNPGPGPAPAPAPDSVPDSSDSQNASARTSETVRPDPDLTARRLVVSSAELPASPRGVWVAALVTLAMVAIAVLFGFFYQTVTTFLTR